MRKNLNKLLEGYRMFREKYARGDKTVMQYLSRYGQNPEVMIVSCSDARVDPALILQCDPGDLFVVRNVANIVPPYEKDDTHHGVSAALEFGVCYLNVKHLILLGHSQCGGIQALLGEIKDDQNDFITKWVSLVKTWDSEDDIDVCARQALQQSYRNCLTFPWIKKRVRQNTLLIHLWFFDIETGQIFVCSTDSPNYEPLKDIGLKVAPPT